MDDVSHRYLEQMLDQLVTLRTDRYGTTRDAMAAAVRESGLPAGVEGLTAVVGRAAAALEASAAELGAALAYNNQLTERLLDATLNPLATRADELRNRGFTAFRNRWFGEAAADLQRAVQTDYRDARSFLILGLAEMEVGRSDYAAEAFERAARYGATTAPEVACGAALLGSRTLDGLERQDRALRLLSDVAARVPSCPEVLLSVARRTGDQALLRTALSLAPELALDAAAADVVHVDVVCRDLLRELEPRARHVQTIATATRKAVNDLGSAALPAPPAPRHDPVLRLATLGPWVHGAGPRLRASLQAAAAAHEQATARNRADAEAASAEVHRQQAQVSSAGAERARSMRFGGPVATGLAALLGHQIFTSNDGSSGGAATLGVLMVVAFGGAAVIYTVRALAAVPSAVQASDRIGAAEGAGHAAQQRCRALDRLHEELQREGESLDGVIRQAAQLEDPPTRVWPFTTRAEHGRISLPIELRA